MKEDALTLVHLVQLAPEAVDSVIAGRQEHLRQVAIRLLADKDIALLDGGGAHGALTQLLMLLLEHALDLSAAVEADASGLHSRVEQALTLLATRTCPDVARESLAHVAAEVEVFEEEGIRLREVVAIADLDGLGLFTDYDLKVHHFTCLGLFHLNGPGARRYMLSDLFESLLFAHLKLERLPEEIEQARAASAGALARFLLLA